MAENTSKRKITIYDVALEADVSLATVSRVINDSSVVKEETRKKVEEAIYKLGYKPNMVAQSLALSKTTTIALILPDNIFSYFGKIMNGLLDVAKIYKYSVTIYTTTTGVNEMNEILENIIKSRADGIIIYNDTLTEKDRAYLDNYNIPVVYLLNKVETDSGCCVYVDYPKAIYNLVSEYLDKGINDIAFVEDCKNRTTIASILKSIEQAYQEHGLEYNGYIPIPQNFHASYDYLRRYFLNHKHQLVLTYRDSQAIATLNSCIESRVAVPEETQIICIMDSRYIDMARPQISAFVIPNYDLGALAMRVMTKLLQGQQLSSRYYELDYTYQQRQTSRK